MKIQKNSPQNSVFEVEIPVNSKKAKISLSTSTNFNLNTIKAVTVLTNQ